MSVARVPDPYEDCLFLIEVRNMACIYRQAFQFINYAKRILRCRSLFAAEDEANSGGSWSILMTSTPAIS